MNSEAAPKFARLAEIVGRKRSAESTRMGGESGLDRSARRRLWRFIPSGRSMTALAPSPPWIACRTIPCGGILFDEMAWESSPAICRTRKNGCGASRATSSHALGLLGARVAAPIRRGAARCSGKRWIPVTVTYWPSRAIAMAYAQLDPAAAGRWAMTLPDGDIRQHGAEGVARAWVAADPVAASAVDRHAAFRQRAQRRHLSSRGRHQRLRPGLRLPLGRECHRRSRKAALPAPAIRRFMDQIISRRRTGGHRTTLARRQRPGIPAEAAVMGRRVRACRVD